MARFIHLTDQKNEKSVLTNGIKTTRLRNGDRFVFCHPLLPDFNRTHQWCRELKRRGVKTFTSFQFSIPDDEIVQIGRFGKDKLKVSAAESHAIAQAHDAEWGLEVQLFRKVLPSEIERFYPAPTLTGWRFFPEAKRTTPCFCRYCNRGEIKAQALIRRG